MEFVGSTVVTDTFSERARPPWHNVSGDYMVTSGDSSPVRGADGGYLRVLGRDCSNLSPFDCDQKRGVSSYVNLAEIAGTASVYHVLVFFDIVAEGDLDGEFSWDIPDLITSPRHWGSSSLEPSCVEHDQDGNCVEYREPTLDYSLGPRTTGEAFWAVDQSEFTQEFFSTERYGFWALDGFWGIDNLRIHVDTYAPRVVDQPPGSAPEPATQALLGLGLAAIGALRRKRKGATLVRSELPPVY